MNNNEPPQKNPKKLGKKAFLTLFKQCQTHQKQTFLILKPQKNKPQTTPFCHVQKQPTIFHESVFCQHTVFVFEKLCFAESTIKIVLSGKHSFSKTQLVKPTFSTMSKKHPFPKKVSFLLFFTISAETPIFIVFPALHCFGPKKHFGQNR